MVAVSKMLHPAANLPVSSKEFFNAFASIWRPTARSRNSDLLNVGLAISGGVDSMALAALCSKLNHVDLKTYMDEEPLGFRNQKRLSFKAFIVDHGARDGSDEEAFLVSKNLEKIGIPAHVLKLQWPSGCKPTELSNFESVARKLRYQALGKACYNHDIEPLLTAHHEDDQVETVVMRLLRGARGVNLQGIRSSTDIPECHGIYGVNRSGGLPCQPKRHGEQSIQGIQPIHIQMESGGIRLYRPLLNFSKSRLIATSIHLHAPWFEDKTNTNPTLTQRNAIRHLYQNNLMPKALSKPSIIRLARNMQLRHNSEEAMMKTIYSKGCIENFDWNAGTLKVRFPNLCDVDTKETRETMKRAAAKFLRGLIYFVTPNENVELSSLGTACEAVFPKLFSTYTTEPSQISTGKQANSFTISGVQFTRMALAVSLPSEVVQEQPAETELEDGVWLLSRQAYNRSAGTLPSINFPPSSLSFPRELDSNLLTDKAWSMWYLYDGRFWIRISNYTSFPVTVRPFREAHMAQFSTCPKQIYPLQGLGKGLSAEAKDLEKWEFALLMKRLFPGAIRYTLPAIVTTDQKLERVLALPSTGIAARGLREAGLDWEIRYKCVDVVNHLDSS